MNKYKIKNQLIYHQLLTTSLEKNKYLMVKYKDNKDVSERLKLKCDALSYQINAMNCYIQLERLKLGTKFNAVDYELQNVLNLHLINGLSAKEIASHLGIDFTKVKQILQKCTSQTQQNHRSKGDD